MRNITAEQREWFLFAIVLIAGALLMLIAGHFALQMPDHWQIRDTNMDSRLNPDEVYAVYREDNHFRLAPIRTDAPNLLATGAAVHPNQNLPPAVVDFKAPGVIATTTPFKIGLISTDYPGTPTVSATLPLAATSEQTATDPVVAVPSITGTSTFTVTPTLWPTRTATCTRTPSPSSAITSTVTVLLTASETVSIQQTSTQTATHTSTIGASPTHTITPEPTATFTVTPTYTPTVTSTNTATPTNTPTATQRPDCIITASGNYTIPMGGCSVRFATDAQGVILSMSMISSGNITVHWHGLPDNVSSGICAAQTSNLTRGIPLINIAVSKYPEGSFTIDNTNSREIEVTILVIDWLNGGCQ